MWRQAFEAADYMLTLLEERLDRLIGAELRLALGRYLSVLMIGAPVAWYLNGRQWTHRATGGLIGGLLLYALIDVAQRAIADRRAKKKKTDDTP